MDMTTLQYEYSRMEQHKSQGGTIEWWEWSAVPWPYQINGKWHGFYLNTRKEQRKFQKLQTYLKYTCGNKNIWIMCLKTHQNPSSTGKPVHRQATQNQKKKKYSFGGTCSTKRDSKWWQQLRSSSKSVPQLSIWRG